MSRKHLSRHVRAAIGALGFSFALVLCPSTLAQPCVAPTVTVQGSRYLTITPSAADPTPVSIRLITDNGVPQCDRYVELEGNPALQMAGVARLVSGEVFRAPAEWGTLQVRGLEIVPSASYTILVKCNFPAPELAPPVVVAMGKWGDCVGSFDGSQWTPPDGVVTISDAVSVVDRFRNISSAPPIVRVDVHPLLPDYNVDIIDIVSVLNAFRGQAAPTDCNGNLRTDVCDLIAGSSADCDGNGTPDECDSDCDGDGIPNNCEGGPEDCDGDGVTDCQDLCVCSTPADRACICPAFDRCCFPEFQICFDDYDRTSCLIQGGIPDCEPFICDAGCLLGDFDRDGDVDQFDYDEFAACYGGPGISVSIPCLDGDYDNDFDVDCADWTEFERHWTEGGAPPALPQCP